MKLTKKQAKNFLKGWDIVKEHNKGKLKQISMEEYINAFDETIKEGKDFCTKCNLCDFE
jgi:radical SAM superfamily enzyme